MPSTMPIYLTMPKNPLKGGKVLTLYIFLGIVKYMGLVLGIVKKVLGIVWAS